MSQEADIADLQDRSGQHSADIATLGAGLDELAARLATREQEAIAMSETLRAAEKELRQLVTKQGQLIRNHNALVESHRKVLDDYAHVMAELLELRRERNRDDWYGNMFRRN